MSPVVQTTPYGPAAHEAFLEGRYHLAKGSADAISRALELFDQSIGLDPDYAAAHVGRAEALLRQNSLPRERSAQVSAALKRALELDDTLAEAEVNDQFADKIHEFGKSLENKEKKIFEDRLVAEDPKTLQTLGDEFGVSRERVRQIEKRLLKKLKDFLHKELGETVVEVYESP